MSPTLNNPLVKIGVLGVGGAGCNAVNMMVEEKEFSGSVESDLSYSIFNDVEIIAANTDSQDLENSRAESKFSSVRLIPADGEPERSLMWVSRLPKRAR